MLPKQLAIELEPSLKTPSLLLSFYGWMDGGDVSTGTMNHLVQVLNAPQFAQINPAGFYIYNFPGTMEFSALFRPHTVIREGLVTVLDEPSNLFYASETKDMIFFVGKEPNFAWDEY